MRGGYQSYPALWRPSRQAQRRVMPEQTYERVLDTSLLLDERREAFFHRPQFFY